MQITIVTGPFLPVPPVRGGGVERMWHQLSAAFAGQGHMVTIVCRSFPGQPAEEVIGGVRYLRVRGYTWTSHFNANLIKTLFYVMGVLPRIPRTDILVISCIWLPLLAQLRRSSVGKVAVCMQRQPKLDVQLYRRADRFYAPSWAIARSLAVTLPGQKERIRVIGNPVQTTVYRPGRVDEPGSGFCRLLFVGRLHPEKGVHLLIEAFALLKRQAPKVQLRIVGSADADQGGGGSAYRAELHRLASGLDIEFETPVFDSVQLASIYRQADVFCYPSLSTWGEALPLAVLEAMASGLAPVVSSLACFQEAVIDGETGCVFDYEAANASDLFANVLLKLLSEPHDLARIRKNAVRKAAEFSVEAISRQYLEDFAALML